jgi:IS5 family transposase
VKLFDKNFVMKLTKENQMNFMRYEIEDLVHSEHRLRKVKAVIDFNILSKEFSDLETNLGRKGYGIERGIECLFLQFFYDLSDREFEERIRDDVSFKWFCGFSLKESTQDHTFLSRFRKTLGTKRVGEIFSLIVLASERAKILRPVFTFVDASSIKRKETTWKERDKALANDEDKFNNDNAEKYSSDKDARFGCKGKDKFWFGYKRHISSDMSSGLIKKVAVTKANVPDHKGLKNICPSSGMVFADKGYATKESNKILKAKGCHSGIILKNNMKNKNKDKDKWISKVRMPHERVFSKVNKRTRYMGLVKTQMQAFMESIVYNIKILLTINAPPLFAGGI